MPVKIVTWNLNSIRARLALLQSWLEQHHPDIVLLQELKCQAHQMPTAELEDLGYNIAMVGQKTYNGVAILSKFPIEDIVENISEFNNHDGSARYIECVTNQKRVASVYVPNGQEVNSTAYHYKIEFLEALTNHWERLKQFDEEAILAGDFNVAPSDLDVYDPDLWWEKTLCTTKERNVFQQLLSKAELNDLFYMHHTKDNPFYTWWDYRQMSYKKNNGLRIDHILVNKKTKALVQSLGVDKKARAESKTSDHAPVWCITGSSNDALAKVKV